MSISDRMPAAAWLAAGLLLAVPIGAKLHTAHAAGTTMASARLTTGTIRTCTLSPSQDTHAASAWNTATFGDDATMHVRSGFDGDARAFVQFDVATCAIATTATVRGARLDLYLAVAPANARTYEARAATAGWNESSLTWDAQPAVEPTATDTTSTGTTDSTTLTFDLSADVRSIVHGTSADHGWRISDQVELDPSAEQSTFATLEHVTASERPTLTITYYS